MVSIKKGENLKEEIKYALDLTIILFIFFTNTIVYKSINVKSNVWVQ